MNDVVRSNLGKIARPQVVVLPEPRELLHKSLVDSDQSVSALLES
jgi:hypothetical protein